MTGCQHSKEAHIWNIRRYVIWGRKLNLFQRAKVNTWHSWLNVKPFTLFSLWKINRSLNLNFIMYFQYQIPKINDYLCNVNLLSQIHIWKQGFWMWYEGWQQPMAHLQNWIQCDRYGLDTHFVMFLLKYIFANKK